MRTKVSDTGAIYAGSLPLDSTFKISITEQVLRSWNCSSEQGLKISHIFVDLSTSESLAERMNFRRMVKEARAGRFDIIVLLRLEYFCRSQAELIAAKEFLIQSGVPFHNAIEMVGH
jgi:DNA invertase Pin-like site-specific DNA recombinase